MLFESQAFPEEAFPVIIFIPLIVFSVSKKRFSLLFFFLLSFLLSLFF
jgi:hypothetical protein